MEYGGNVRPITESIVLGICQRESLCHPIPFTSGADQPVVGKKIVDLFNSLTESLTPLPQVVEKAERQILTDAAGAHVGSVHARATHALRKFEKLLALLEEPEIGRHSADIQTMATRDRKKGEKIRNGS